MTSTLAPKKEYALPDFKVGEKTEYRYIDDVKVAISLGLAKPTARTAHLHTLRGKALVGGSSLKGIIGDKSRLFQYYADRAAVSALALPQQDITEEYEAIQKLTGFEKSNAMKALCVKYPDFKYARLAANRHRDDAAKSGTARHSKLEDYVRDCLQFNDGKPEYPLIEGVSDDIRKFRDWAIANVERFSFTEANCYSEPIWAGGIADLGLELKDGRRVVCDHKSSKEAYPDQFLQCAIYDVLLSWSGGLDKDGNKLFDWKPADGYVVFPFRSEPFTPEYRWNAEEWREGVVGAGQLYKLMEINN